MPRRRRNTIDHNFIARNFNISYLEHRETFHTIGYQTLAAAAALTALTQVNLLATRGFGDHAIQGTLYQSLQALDSEQPEDIYPSKQQLQPGYATMARLLPIPSDADDKRLLSYWISINRIARQLLNKPAMQTAIRQELAQLSHRQQLAATDWSRDDEEAVLARLYQNTISTLPLRVNIIGGEKHLTQLAIKNQIRALLLAATRAMVLWRQLGGNLTQLVFRRKNYASECQRVLRTFDSA